MPDNHGMQWGTDPLKLDPTSTKSFQPPLVLKFLPSPSPSLRAFIEPILTGGKKHENTNLLHKLITQNNCQQMRKTNEIKGK